MDNSILAMTRLFSPSVYRELGSSKEPLLLPRLLKQSNLPKLLSPNTELSTAFDWAYDNIRRPGLRPDYVYRNAIIKKVHLGRHSLRTSQALQEFRIENRKVDLALLNTRSTAYEIKSDRDNTQRLIDQLEKYAQVFQSTYLVCSPLVADSIQPKIPSHVGILQLSTQYTLQTIRKAETEDRLLNSRTISRCMTIPEAVHCLDQIGVTLPQVPNTQTRCAIEEAFSQIQPTTAASLLNRELKRTRRQFWTQETLDSLPESLLSRALASTTSALTVPRVLERLHDPIKALLP